MKAADDRGTLIELETFPTRLGFPGTSYCALNVGRAGNLNMSNDFAGGGIPYFDGSSFFPGDYDMSVALL
jgi:hypothetical protein